MAFKKMVAAFHDHHLFWLRRSLNNFFQALRRTVLVARSADKEFWPSAIWQVLISVSTTFNAHRRSQRNDPNHALVVAGDAQPRSRAKRKSAENHWQMKRGIKPVQRRPNIFLLAMPAIMFAITQSCAAKVEAQHRKAKAAQRLHGMVNDFVVHRPAK